MADRKFGSEEDIRRAIAQDTAIFPTFVVDAPTPKSVAAPKPAKVAEPPRPTAQAPAPPRPKGKE